MHLRHRAVLAFSLCAVATTGVRAQHPLEGAWVGGYQQGRNYVYLSLSFTARADSLSGTAQVPFQLRRPAPITDLVWRNGQAAFSLAEREGTHRVSLSPRGDELEGTIDLGGRSLPLHMLRVIPVLDKRRDALHGLYRLSDGSLIGISGRGELGFGAVLDFRTGLFRSLFPLRDGSFATGPGWYAPYPRTSTLRFDSAGSTLRWRDANGERTGQRMKFRQEVVRFQNGDVTLVGRLTLPDGPGPFPVLVFIHGSGPGTRQSPFFLAEYFATRGIATLGYDKRGVGESTGIYTHDVNATEFERLAGDALAGVALLRTRPEIDPARIGLWGISQAGWIIALAAQSPQVAFSVVVSGPAVSLGEENYFSRITGDDGDGTRLPDSAVATRMRNVQPSGFDPRPHIGRIRSPSLWIFGGRDPSVPVERSIAVLDSARSVAGSPIEVRSKAAGNHLMLDSEVGNRDEYPLLQRFVAGYFAEMVEWVLRQPGNPNARSAHP
jgi:dienelactone hydrolase